MKVKHLYRLFLYIPTFSFAKASENSPPKLFLAYISLRAKEDIFVGIFYFKVL